MKVFSLEKFPLYGIYVQSIYLVGGGLIIEANIPVQELEGQRGRGLIFGRIRYYTCIIINYDIVQQLGYSQNVLTL